MDWRDGKSNTQFTIGERKKIKFLPRWKCLIKVGLITSSDISIKTNQQLPRGDEFGSLRKLVFKCFGSCHRSWKHNNYGQRTLPFTCERQSANFIFKKMWNDWLAQEQNHFTSRWCKNPELYDFAKPQKPRHKTYEIDSTASLQGFKILRLPPYYCQYDAIEVCSALKGYVKERNSTRSN